MTGRSLVKVSIFELLFEFHFHRNFFRFSRFGFEFTFLVDGQAAVQVHGLLLGVFVDETVLRDPAPAWLRVAEWFDIRAVQLQGVAFIHLFRYQYRRRCLEVVQV